MNFDKYRSIVADSGWLEIEKQFSQDELIAFSSRFGKIIEHPNGRFIDQISPKTKHLSIKNSLSYEHEFNEFPLHTDTSFWIYPTKYVILYSELPSTTATTIINFREVMIRLSSKEKALLTEGIFLVKTQNVSFYTSILNKNGGNSFIRFDDATMKPINKKAKALSSIIKDILTKVKMSKIIWNKPKLLVLDNWHTMHGREKLNSTSEQRILNRIYLK